MKKLTKRLLSIVLSVLVVFGAMPIAFANDAPETPVFETDLEATKTATVGDLLHLQVNATVNDGGTVTYQWYKDDKIISGATSRTYSPNPVCIDHAGSYKVVATNGTAAAESTVCEVTVNDESLIAGKTYTYSDVTNWYKASANDSAGIYLTDGNFTYTFYNDNYAGISGATKPVVTFDLSDDPITFKEIYIHSLVDVSAGVTSPNKYDIEYQAPGSDEWVLIAEHKSSDTSKGKIVFRADEAITAKGLRFTFHSSQFTFLNEIRVFAEETNVAADAKLAPTVYNVNYLLNQPYTHNVTSFNGTSKDPNNTSLTDGVTGGTWYGGDYLNATQDVTVEFDLGEEKDLGEIFINFLVEEGSGVYPATSGVIYIKSNTYTDWQKIYEGEIDEANFTITTENPLKASAIKFELKRVQFLFIKEIEAYPRPTGRTSHGIIEIVLPNPNLLPGKTYTYGSEVTDASWYKAGANDSAGTFLTDGKFTGSFYNTGYAGIMNTSAPSVIFDFEDDPLTFQELFVSVLLDASAGISAPKKFDIEYKPVGSDEWILILEQKNTETSSKKDYRFAGETAFTAEALRFTFHGGQFIFLNEIEAYQRPTKQSTDGILAPTVFNVNYLEGMTYTHDVTSWNGASKDPNGTALTDGKLGGSWYNGNYFNALGNATIEFDLGEDKDLSELIITSTDIDASASVLPPANAIIYAKATTDEDYKIIYTGSVNDTLFVLSTKNPIKARYLKIKLSAAGVGVFLTEIEAYPKETGATPDGRLAVFTPPTGDATQTFVSMSGDNVKLVSSYSASENIVFTLGRKGPNSLMEIKNVYFVDANLSGQEAVMATATRTLYSSYTDHFGPYVVFAKNNGLDEYTNTFTGGNHGYLNSGDMVAENSATGRSVSVAIYADGEKVTNGFNGYADIVTLDWVNAIQATNTKLADGTGREVMEEHYQITYAGGIFDITQTITPLEDIYIHTFYGNQMVTSWGTEGVKYMNGSRQDWFPTSASHDSGNQICNGYTVRNESDYVEVTFDKTYSLGKGEYLSSTVPTAHSQSYGKSYFNLINVTDESASFGVGDSIGYKGQYKYYYVGEDVPAGPTESATPSITTDLAATADLTEGDALTLSVVAEASDEGTLSYQWYKGDNAIAGATNATYTIAAVTTADAGSYKVVVTNTKDSLTPATATSAVCVVTVEEAVTIMYGDVTGDGKVNRSDLLRLAKNFGGATVEINQANSDVTDDGRVNRNDLLSLAKYFGGASVTLGPAQS